MASKAHQFIASCIVRKMREEGYDVIAFEGDYTKIGDIRYRIPFSIKKHRPDIIGISKDKSRICIGEAKTFEDLLSKRTKEELSDFANIKIEDLKCKLIIGVPKSSESLLKQILQNIEIYENPNISYLLIPEELFPNEEEL